MDRRSFIRLLGAGLVAPIVEPQIKYILPPIGGWNVRQKFSQVMMPGLKNIYYDDLIRELYINPDFDIVTFKESYLNKRARAQEAWMMTFKQTQTTKRSS